MTDPENATTASADTDQASNVKVRVLRLPVPGHVHFQWFAEDAGSMTCCTVDGYTHIPSRFLT